MITDNYISSLQNPKIKRLIQLQQKSSDRRKEQLFVVEGHRELFHCIEGGYVIDSVFTCPDFLNDEATKLINLLDGNTSKYIVSNKVYERIAYRGTTEGLIALVRMRDVTLNDLKLSDSPLIVVLERVEKPGNLGAILRSADAAGVHAVIICDPLTDIYNPNLIRSSIGAVFTVPCLTCCSEECIAFLKSKGIKILTAQLQDSSLYYNINMKRPTAIVMGAESTGLTSLWRDAADAHIRIPMLGKMDSLNVSTSAAILLYEAVRQREEGL